MYIKVAVHTDHFILSESSSLVGEQELDSTQLLWYGAAADHCARDGPVSLDHPRVHHLSHVQVDPQTAA